VSGRHKAEANPEIALPITPMLDMAFQLLTFFIFTYHPSGMEGQMDMSLPSESAKAAHDQKDVTPESKADKNESLDLPADLTVMVRTQQDGVNNGIISALTVENRSGPEPVANLQGLEDYLKKAHESVDNKSAIKIQADGKLKWGEVVKIMDVCRKAGFDNISFVPPPDFNLGV